MLKLLLQHNLAFLQINHLEDSYFNYARDGSFDLLNELQNMYFPETTKNREDANRRSVKAMVGGWNKRFGDSNDPEVRKKIEAAAAAMLARHKEARESKQRRPVSRPVTPARKRRYGKR